MTYRKVKKGQDIMCRTGTFNITQKKGECPESCKYGAWHMTQEGICGAESDCGGTLYITNKNEIYCDS